MKIRNGFVSNSSSSSFILNADGNTVRDIALLMIPQRNWPNDYDLISRIQKLTCDPDLPITFSTCNYDTFIIKIGKYIYVNTCHNHDFDEVLGKFKVRDIDTVKEREEIFGSNTNIDDNDNFDDNADEICYHFCHENNGKFFDIYELEKMQKEKSNENS